tara:strand:+ start:958 stop:2859 length:1902 start_codon:yes stop_codon:yes gene_type:complete
MKTIRITESQYSRLFRSPEEFMNEILSPLREVLKCRITEDRKHLVYEGKVYDAKTGDELPLTEQALGMTKALGTAGKVAASDDGWSISDILHTGVDIISTAADFIVPGSGAIIDIVHALSYVVEAQFSSGEEKDTLYLMGAITGMFAILPGALQAVAPILKRFVKTGGKMALKKMPLLKMAWESVSKNISKFLGKLPQWVDKAVNSSIGKRILGKYADKISSAVKNFSTRIRSILDKLKGKTDDVIKKGKEAIDVAKTKLDPLKSKTANTQRWLQQKTSKLIDKFSPNAYSKSNKIISKDGKILDLMTKNGKVNPQALTSINRTGGFDKYKDVLVYDLKSGKLYGKNSKEGIKAIADNTKLINTKGAKISDKIPEEWLDAALNKSLKQSAKKSMGKGVAGILSKKLPKISSGNSKNVVLKAIGWKGLTGNEKWILKTLHNAGPLGLGRNFWKNVGNIFKKGGKISKKKSLMKAIGNLMVIDIYMQLLTRFFCNVGIKNRDDAERFFEFYEDVKWETEGSDNLVGDVTLKIIAGMYNIFMSLSDNLIVGIFDKPCKSGSMPAKFMYDVLDNIPYLDELIPGYTTFKDFLKDFGGVYDEGIENIDLDSALQDLKDGKKPTLDSNEEPEFKIVQRK